MRGAFNASEVCRKTRLCFRARLESHDRYPLPHRPTLPTCAASAALPTRSQHLSTTQPPQVTSFCQFPVWGERARCVTFAIQAESSGRNPPVARRSEALSRRILPDAKVACFLGGTGLQTCESSHRSGDLCHPRSTERSAPTRVVPLTWLPPCGQTPHSDSFQIKQQHCEIRRGDAADAARLAYARGPNPMQLLARFQAKLPDALEVEIARNPLVFEPLEAFHL